MTDNEFKKVVEQCRKNENCIGCPLEHLDYSSECVSAIIEYCYDKINRQKAEIEKLESDLETLNGQYLILDMAIETAKAEAYKECIEKVKPIISDIVDLMFDDNISKCQLPSCHKPSSISCESEICIQENKEYWHRKLDNILKEMEGEK